MGDQSTIPAREAPGRLLRMRDVMRETGLSRRTIERRVNAGTFPGRIRLGPQSVAWSEREIEAWKQEQIAAQH